MTTFTGVMVPAETDSATSPSTEVRGTVPRDPTALMVMVKLSPATMVPGMASSSASRDSAPGYAGSLQPERRAARPKARAHMVLRVF
jgi:hypothetical protein